MASPPKGFTPLPYGARTVPLLLRLDRLPIRVRVTLTFTAAMAVLLAATGSFLYLRLAGELGATLDRGLRSRADDVIALVSQADSGLAQAGRSPLTKRGENLAQISDLSGHVVDAPPPLRRRPLLSGAERRQAASRTIFVDHSRSPLDGKPIRLLATATIAQDRRLIVVVGASLQPRDDALAKLRGLLLLGGPIALLLASLAGYGAAAGALRPMDSMRRRAGEINAGIPGRRLPVPPSRDEVARLGETLNDMLERLEDALARERRFVADASHELRTPLAILKGELELALHPTKSLEAIREAVSSAAEETDRLVELAEDLLVLARLEQGRLPVRTSLINARDLLEGIARRYARRAEGAHIRVMCHGSPDLTVTADRLRLEQAVSNLVENALQHGRGTVELEAIAVDDEVEIHVRDRGPGFPAALREVAFERFTRGDSARGRGGTGLGMAIVVAIAEAHDGVARVGDRPGGGADVSLALPGDPAPEAHSSAVHPRR